ncbi:adenine-specific DNA-methyltransferase [Candidatus Kinetoplastibacterium blastocrithidii TCC012E]|uniref:Adenine-specific DNA-methyltransferase n=1 Tax=Candidatus Kinetoplastidibacterium blastocrithidiae TCC012E TaxID=1208922 RepID=M1MD24_9PROT|nr:50S ribosomal protein L3 N(5)-glutamine methyltransferase [Candidatus Kinetoplastibacterium blastocrithidii]AFZ83551.1 adenine-specific DNA-methyltransferase [Candidatus Kinetoplastibacterium blastocrithidii (ex Strigomonas culicis)]AGF49670.1 adenine-specific DNA-methyltransferase [Candidatus Kinetoplastibacterium blastocrithidii TCC012E]
MINYSCINQLRTLRDIIRYTTTIFNKSGIFFGHGSDNAYDEAIYLILHSLSLPVDNLDIFLDSNITKNEIRKILYLINKRIRLRIPASYLTKESLLQGYKFYINNNVIIPRSPISELIQNCLYPWVKDSESITSILDLCTGSGCLAILAAFAFQQSMLTATDISVDALRIAEKNIKHYNLQDRIKTINSDLFDKIPSYQYDIVICNPPYVNTLSLNNLPEEYLHEPIIALDGGDDGMHLIKRILKKVKSFLKSDGILVLEIGNEYNNFMKHFQNINPTWVTTSNTENNIMLLNKAQIP